MNVIEQLKVAICTMICSDYPEQIMAHKANKIQLFLSCDLPLMVTALKQFDRGNQDVMELAKI